MNRDKVTESIKKNLLSILCGVVALAAVIASVWPVGGFIAKLKADAEQHASAYSALQGLLNQGRKLPLTDPSKTDQEDLKQFPTDAIIDAGNKATSNVSDQSKKMVDLVVAVNQTNHRLLVPDSLPVAHSDSAKTSYRDTYVKVLSNDPTVSMKTDPYLIQAKQPNLINDILVGGVPPTAADFKARQDLVWDRDFKIKIYTVGGVAQGEAEARAQFAKRAATIPDEMKNEVAMNHRIYVNPDAFAINPSVGVGAALQSLPDSYNIWISQLQLWVQQDVALAIAQANSSSTNILDAPIKRLVSLTFSSKNSPIPYELGTAGAATAAGPPTPLPVEGGDIAVLTKAYNVSPTGRVCNQMYDVVPFILRIDVDKSKIPFVLGSLCQNRLIDVYKVDIVSLDTNDQSAQSLAGQGYMYGPHSVVRLTLTCESLFMRKWTVPWMPDKIRTLLNIASPTAPTGPTAMAQ